MALTRFPTDDHPVDVLEVEIERPEQWLAREEPYDDRNLPEIVDAVSVVLVLHADAHPHVLGPLELRRELGKSLVALGQNLEDMPRTLSHDLEDVLQEV